MRGTGTKRGPYVKPEDRPTVCSVEGCTRPPHPVMGWLYCVMHWRRVQKHGQTGGNQRLRHRGPWLEARGFFLTHLPDHPLAPASGDIRLARVIAYKQWGPDGAACRDCGEHLSWGRRLLVVHVDGHRANCDPDNLAASCMACHARRHGWSGGGDT